MKIISFLFFTGILLVTIYSCNTTEPGDDSKLTLTVEDVSCTEAWLTLAAENVQLPAEISIKRTDPDGHSISQISILNNQDTLLYIDSLLPNKTYSFQASLQTSSQITLSNEVTATTMDTTSHNFTWQTFTFGEHSSSVLNDVAIIDENNIWVVGEIYMNDSLGQPDPVIYNAVHWDGDKWTVNRIPYNYEGQLFYHPIQSVFAFAEDNIWFCGNGIIYWDGKLYNPIPISSNVWGPFQINKIWGTSSDNLYIVGNGGNIAHYNGQNWQKIESGTELNINDIWGELDTETGEYEILAPASNILESLDREIIKINKASTELLGKEGIPGTLSSIWFRPESKYFLGGGGVFEKTNLNNKIWENGQFDITHYYIYKIRGENFNDITAAGGAGEVLHFNGLSWQSYFEKIKLNFGNYYSAAIKNNIIIAVGEDSPRAVIAIGRR